MNNLAFPTNPSIEGLKTPVELGPDIDPRLYMETGQWPGLPTLGLVAVIPAAVKKQIGKLLADRGEALAIRGANDVAFARQQMLAAARDGSDFGAFESERISREIGKMDLEAFGGAVERLRDIEVESRKIVADLLPKFAELKLAEFTAEAQAFEERLARHGRALSETKSEDGYIVTRWALWSDSICADCFVSYWYLCHYWPVELVTPRYENRDALAFLAEVLATA
jgi:hypothetical protein